MSINKHNLISLAGFIWGLSGFTVELISPDASLLQMLLRLFFVLASSLIILSTLKVKIKQKYYFAISLFFMYYIAYLTTSIIHGIMIVDAMRETFLLAMVLILYILFSNKLYFFDFIKGLIVSVGILVLYYFFHIDFFQIFTPFYRLFTGLNPNGIGTISVMTFTLSYFFLFSKEYTKNKYIYLILTIMSIVIIFATKSRTSLLMLFFSFIILNIFFKNRKILIFSLLMVILVFILKYDAIETLLRLKSAEGYSGPNNIYNLTGRTELWKHGWDVIKENLLFGVGPKDAYVMVDGHKGTYHNAYIQLFITVGLFGFLPILIMLLLAIRAVILSSKLYLIKAIFIVGIIGSMAESQLFNFGSPGNLLFLLALLYLMGIDKKRLKYDINY